jgi:hypothetical protein
MPISPHLTTLPTSISATTDLLGITATHGRDLPGHSGNVLSESMILLPSRPPVASTYLLHE